MPSKSGLYKVGTSPFFSAKNKTEILKNGTFAAEHFPVHAACPVFAGITKCAEGECDLALRQDAGIFFEE